MPFEERLGLTSTDRLQEYDHMVNQKCRQRTAQNLSEMATYSVQQPACPSTDWTVELVPSSSPQCPQTMLAVTWLMPMLLPLCSWVTLMLSAHTSNWKLKQCCRGARESTRGFNSKQGQQLQKPPLNCICLLQLADTLAADMLQPGLAILVVAIPLLCAGLASSPE